MFLRFTHFWLVLFGRKSFHNPPLKSGEFHCTSLRAAVPFSSQSPTPSHQAQTILPPRHLSSSCSACPSPSHGLAWLSSLSKATMTSSLSCHLISTLPRPHSTDYPVNPSCSSWHTLCDLPPHTCSYLSHPPVAPANAQLTILSLILTCAAGSAQALPTTPTTDPGFSPDIFFL